MKKIEQPLAPQEVFLVESLINELSMHLNEDTCLPENTDIRSDVDLIYKFYELQKLVRFFGQRYWENESGQTASTPGELDLENVAAHSYQVARCASLLAPHFPWIDPSRAMELALVHDEPEIVIGDKDPVGDGQGQTTHAFNAYKRYEKAAQEKNAVDVLTATMRPSIRDRYKQLSAELIEDMTAEAKFVKAVDKLQSLTFVRLKKGGSITPEHMAFTIRYTRIGVRRFPNLQGHFKCVLRDLIEDVALAKPAELHNFCSATRLQFQQAENK